jgi:hypothetical protein
MVEGNYRDDVTFSKPFAITSDVFSTNDGITNQSPEAVADTIWLEKNSTNLQRGLARLAESLFNVDPPPKIWPRRLKRPHQFRPASAAIP